MKILIADDEAVSRRLLQNYLEKWGHAVSVCENGGAAWRLFETDDFPIVITDWMMPELDGVDLIRRIRASQRPHYIYTILLTARSQKEDVVEGMEAGADDFITKPFDRDELRVRLRAGERVLQLEGHLAELNRSLCEAQAALARLEQEVAAGRHSTLTQFQRALDGLCRTHDLLRNLAESAASHDAERPGAGSDTAFGSALTLLSGQIDEQRAAIEGVRQILCESPKS